MTKTTTTEEGPEIPVHVIHVIDRSGSMSGRQHAVVAGMNSFLADQKTKPGKCRITIVSFDSNGVFGGPQTIDYRVHQDATKLANVPDFTVAEYQPYGGTPLFDCEAKAIHAGIAREQARAAAGKPEEAVIVVSWTDGMENTSTEYTAESLAALKAEREKAGWTFIQQGLGFDAREQAAASGTHVSNTVSYGGGEEGVAMAFAGTSALIGNYRGAAKRGARSVLRSASTDAYKALDMDKPDDDAAVVSSTKSV